jgi:hypothetical protein
LATEALEPLKYSSGIKNGAGQNSKFTAKTITYSHLPPLEAKMDTINA